jgi:deazaflavin-dependent oxidoreductase (nitroreductase family)
MNPMRPIAIRVGRLTWLPKFLPQIVWLDLFVRRLTRGKISLLTFAGVPEVFLTVTGRKSGVARTTPLLCAPHDGGWLIAGSNWGQPKPPAWTFNLAAAETAEVEFKGRSYVVVPRKVEGAERAELWKVLNATWPNYDRYAARVDREIPVFELKPR